MALIGGGTGLGALINAGGLTFIGGGTGLANALSIGAVGSAIGLGLAAYAVTRPQESSGGYGYQQQSSGYHKRKGIERAERQPSTKGGRIAVASSKGPKRQGGKVNGPGPSRDSKVSEGRANSGNGKVRQRKFNQEGPSPGKDAHVVVINTKDPNQQGSVGVGRQSKSGPSHPAKIVTGRGKVGRPVRKLRTKREEQDSELSPLDVLQIEEQLELQETLELIRKHDTTGCGKRLMCELANMDQEQLTVEELSILNLVSHNTQSGVRPNQASQEYLDAKTKGQQGEDCGQVYPLCKMNGKQLMSIVMDYLP
ncbi:unnamed protein product [Meganyctiphanes norvegica]|uniref:Uncharacterized protein n=1 Tax=Meganyctiphanes norvegica TaxID=48144 RepID=A0AAV2PZA4_MEGNR